MSDLVKVSISFTTMSLVACLIFSSVVTVCAFGISAALFGFIAFIERKNRLEVERFESDVKSLNDKITGLAMTLGWKNG